MIRLTDKQNAVFTYIKQFISLNEEAPTISEIQKHFSLKSKRGVIQYLETLQRKGLIERSSKTRGIELVEKFNNSQNSFTNIHVFGYANAGEPFSLSFQDRIASIKVDKKLLPRRNKVYALIMKGDSMNKRRINHIQLKQNNYLIVDRDAEVTNGDVVVAKIDDTAIAKAYQRHGQQIILYPESTNPIHQPLYMHEESSSLLNGKVIGILDNTSFKND